MAKHFALPGDAPLPETLIGQYLGGLFPQVRAGRDRPNLSAINQNRKFTKNIGIIVPHIVDPFYAEILRPIEQRCAEAGYWAIETLYSLRVAGAIIVLLGDSSAPGRIRQLASDTPTVIFDNHIDREEIFVGTDNFQSIGLIAAAYERRASRWGAARSPVCASWSIAATDGAPPAPAGSGPAGRGPRKGQGPLRRHRRFRRMCRLGGLRLHDIASAVTQSLFAAKWPFERRLGLSDPSGRMT